MVFGEDKAQAQDLSDVELDEMERTLTKERVRREKFWDEVKKAISARSLMGLSGRVLDELKRHVDGELNSRKPLAMDLPKDEEEE